MGPEPALSAHNHLHMVIYFEKDLKAREIVNGAHCRFKSIAFGQTRCLHGSGHVLLISSESLLREYWDSLRRVEPMRIIALSDRPYRNPRLDKAVYAYLPVQSGLSLVERMIENALDHIRLSGVSRKFNQRLAAISAEIDELNGIGTALSAEHDIPKLLQMILTKSRQITSADAGSVYVVESLVERPAATHISKASGRKSPRRLRFSLSQNDSMHVAFRRSTMEISSVSIAGYAALTGETVVVEDAYHLPRTVPYTINRDFDRKSGYRTKSILAVPMRDQKGKVVGVLQLINAKRNAGIRLTSRSAVAAAVVPFTKHHRELIESLASQAAVALENSRLVRAIERLFEGFVRAAVIAIEERDPGTSGHSFRVAALTLALAEAVNRQKSGPLATVHFAPDELKEIRYAALLHDFGKVAINEQVLIKAAKLYPGQLELIRQRFTLAKCAAEAEVRKSRLAFLLEHGEAAYRREEAGFDSGLQERLAELSALWEAVQQANRPTVNTEGKFKVLTTLAMQTYTDFDGLLRPLLTADELRLLSIEKGSLDKNERAQIEAHVAHTDRFLSHIPWTADLCGIPAIALAHHEKLNGSGYPRGITASEIPVEARMISIADIFDGLTASDRPYKKAVSPERALAVMETEVARGELDADLFQLFAQAHVWRKPHRFI